MLFYKALNAQTNKSADDLTALARLDLDGGGILNPITHTSTVLLKSATAKALGYTGFSGSDGTISLNTAITTPGSPGGSGAYNLTPVVEHEIDEILGLGSTLGVETTLPYSNDPSPEDFFRFASDGTRSYTTSSTAQAFLSFDGTTALSQFDNQNDGGDFGDWQSNPLPNGAAAQVQDAFANPGAAPTLGVELRALDAIGYDRIFTPEPATWILCVVGLTLLACGRLRRKMVADANRAIEDRYSGGSTDRSAHRNLAIRTIGNTLRRRAGLSFRRG